MSTQYIQAREARKNFSKIINSVATTKNSYTIKVRNQPKAVLVDIATANKMDERKDKKLLKNNPKNKTAGELFIQNATKFIVKMKPNDNKVNLSGNIDKILYGI